MLTLKERLIERINKKYKPIEGNPLEESTYKKIMIQNHRRLWKWIMWHTILNRKKINKKEYFRHYHLDAIDNYCYLCEYALSQTKTRFKKCEYCPVTWKRCKDKDNLFQKWNKCYGYSEWVKASYYAWRISIVREKKE